MESFDGKYLALSPVEELFNKELNQKFDSKVVLYSMSQKAYVQIKKFNPDKLSYTCRIINKGEQQQNQEIDIQQDDLVKEINVQVQVF